MSIDIDGPHSYTDPRLLTGQARIEEIGRLLALGILRLYKRQQAACATPNEPRDSMGSRPQCLRIGAVGKINALNAKKYKKCTRQGAVSERTSDH
jgi:hypothetical protein